MIVIKMYKTSEKAAAGFSRADANGLHLHQRFKLQPKLLLLLIPLLALAGLASVHSLRVAPPLDPLSIDVNQGEHFAPERHFELEALESAPQAPVTEYAQTAAAATEAEETAAAAAAAATTTATTDSSSPLSQLNFSSSNSDEQQATQSATLGANTTNARQLIGRELVQPMQQAALLASPSNNNINNNCSAACSQTEFFVILERFIQDDDEGNILKRFEETERIAARSINDSPDVALPAGSPLAGVRPICARELVGLIRSLASNELEMKTMLEFAADSLSSSASSPSSQLESLLAMGRQNASSLDSLRWLQYGINRCPPIGVAGGRPPSLSLLSSTASDSSSGSNKLLLSAAAKSGHGLLVPSQSDEHNILHTDASDKARVLPRIVATVDHWINSLERFTLTREWSSLLKVFQVAESILDTFATPAGPRQPAQRPPLAVQQANSSNSSNSSSNNNSSATDQSKVVQPVGGNSQADGQLMAKLKQELPGQVLTLTTALNNLFPWHVWPWNNLDLYATVDTFLNHGIFAFSKTTVGPERRIDYLNSMLETLFKSLKFETFPKKCADWSKIICDREAYYERLALAPSQADTAELSQQQRDQMQQERAAKARELAKVGKNQLTQELTCIMFSSLSMQHFGARPSDYEVPASLATSSADAAAAAGSSNRLAWDTQVHKALKLYSLAREALSDDQWLELYTSIHDLWSQQKIPDRVIMVGRVIQLLTNCHMPKEMLESALWKDMYKYKNVLNQLLDIVIEELNRSSESGKLQIEQIALGSKNLHEILEKFIRLLPPLLESLSQTVVDQLPELVAHFFNEKAAFFRVPCKGSSFSDIIPSLNKHRVKIIEIEQLICQQLHTKPNITMSQINNLTNDFLAMAFNFSTIGNALAFPKILTDSLDSSSSSSSETTDAAAKRKLNSSKTDRSFADFEHHQTSESTTSTTNVTSIIDEMAANPRLAQVVAILQSSALDPPEVHAELPELDWVEAGTSVAMLYESIQRLMSHEEAFVVFPEIEGFQGDLKKRLDSSQSMFKKFSKRDPARLVAYGLDTVMPIALRTFKPKESFHAECFTSFRDIFSEDIEGKASRQWQCLVSSMNFGSWALNKFMRTFNHMFSDILTLMSSEESGNGQWQSPQSLPLQLLAGQTSATNNTQSAPSCIFFDGSVSMMLDNLPQSIDLALETVLMASTTSEQHKLTLYDIMCSSNYTLDPFNERYIDLRAKMKGKMCHLFYKNSLSNCAHVLKLDQWAIIMRQLNSTWFESNAISIKPSFREITQNAHEFLELFGQFKPSTMSDSLLSRVMNVNSFWTNLLNRIMSIIDKYQEKRFEYALQTLTPIIYDNIAVVTSSNSTSTSALVPGSGGELAEDNGEDGVANKQEEPASQARPEQIAQVRETLVTTILGAKAILGYLDKQSNCSSGSSSNSSSNRSPAAAAAAVAIGHCNSSVTDQAFETQIQSLFNWADQYSMVSAEVFLRTIANNITKLESIFFARNTTSESEVNSSSNSSLKSSGLPNEFWLEFCSKPVATYLDLKQPKASVKSSNSSSASSALSDEEQLYYQMEEGKASLCSFEWKFFYEQLAAGDSSKILAEYSERQLTRIALTKWGQLLDVMLIESKHFKQLPKFFYMDHWQLFRDKLPQISPLKDEPSNLVWIWKGFERLVNAMDSGTNQKTSLVLQRILDQLNCGLDAVKGGLSWENIANIYSDKQDILAAHSTINNGFALASIGVNTFLAHRKFQRFLDELVKPRVGLGAFCELRDRNQLETIFSIPTSGIGIGGEQLDFLGALESFQELLCDTNFETLVQNINPISICYHQPSVTVIAATAASNQNPLADIMDRFFKLASLAIIDAKLVAASDAKPPILDKQQWSNFWDWWSIKAEPQPKSSVALTIVRAFQAVDSVNSNHVVWKALFRSVHEISELAAYLLRAVEKRHQEVDMIGAASRLSLVKKAASQIDSAIRSTSQQASSVGAPLGKQLQLQAEQQQQQQQLASTLSNIMFPEVNNFISFRTFKQLRYIKTIPEYFTLNQGAQDSVCQSQFASNNNNNDGNQTTTTTTTATKATRIDLIGYKLNTNERLYSLLCQYHSSQWLTALNVVLASTRTISIPKKVNLMTKYLSIFTRGYKDNNHLENFIHNQQLETIESVTNSSVAYLLAASNSLKSLSFTKISNISWHSLPNLLDSIDRHLCASKHEPGTFLIPSYEPKRPELETILCKLPQWNISQVYEYLSESFDLQNMISLISPTETNGTTTTTTTTTTITTMTTTAALASMTFASNSTLSMPNYNQTTRINSTISVGQASPKATTTTTPKVATNKQPKTCVTPFKFASRWLKIGQETVDEVMSKSSRDKLRKCLNLARKGQSVYSQSLRFVKFVNSLLASINDLTVSDSWHVVKKTWNACC